MCKTINLDAPTYPGNFENAFDAFDTNDDGVIDFTEFVELDRRYPMILFPAFRLQQKLQKFTLGEKTWVKIFENLERSRRRKEKIRMTTSIHNTQQNSERKKGLRNTILPKIVLTSNPQSNIPSFTPEKLEKIKFGTHQEQLIRITERWNDYNRRTY